MYSYRKPKRYQLKKEAALILKNRHPWIYRTHLSSAADIFKTGQWLKLVDQNNEVLGHGIFDGVGLIAIRIFHFGKGEVSKESIERKVEKALKLREQLKNYTDSVRAIHGENDGLPGVVVDIYSGHAVLQTYSASVDAIGRYVALLLKRKLELKSVLWKVPQKRAGGRNQKETRFLSGHNPGMISIREGKAQFTVDIATGQKSGTFLDLRALRKWLMSENLKGKRVLNLFSYTGNLSLCAEIAGAKEIWSVDISKGAIQFAEKYHTQMKQKHRFIEADIFDWFEKLGPNELFDLIIVDPPNMAAKKDQVPSALKAYAKLYTYSKRHLKPGGKIVGACCTSRIERREFERVIDYNLKSLRCLKDFKPEDDHPVGFPQGDYLKIRVYG